MKIDDNEEPLLRSVALQNAQAVFLARERAERELRESNERIANILESITDAFIGLDKEWPSTYEIRQTTRLSARISMESLPAGTRERNGYSATPQKKLGADTSP